LEAGIIQFFEGVAKTSEGNSRPIIWAESRFGNRSLIDAIIRDIESAEISEIEEKSLVTTVDLMGLDADDTIYIIDAILRGRYWSKLGVRGKLDAALYLLLNEVISELSVPIQD